MTMTIEAIPSAGNTKSINAVTLTPCYHPDLLPTALCAGDAIHPVLWEVCLGDTRHQPIDDCLILLKSENSWFRITSLR